MEDFTFKHSSQVDNISSVYTAAEIKTYYDSRGVELRTFINALVGILNSVTDGSSGADNIGTTTISGLSGNTVQALLEALKTAIDEAVLGQIPDNTLTTAKYQDGSVTAVKCAADVATQAELDAEASTRGSADTTLQGNIDNLAGTGRTTETVKDNADAISAHEDEIATDVILGHVKKGDRITISVDGTISADVQGMTLNSGTFTETTSITGSGDYTKSVALGSSDYKIAFVTIKNTVSSNWAASFIIARTAANTSRAIGVTRAPSVTVVGSMNSVDSKLSIASSTDTNLSVSGHSEIYLNHVYINGSNLEFKWTNTSVSARSLAITVQWEVLK